MRSSAIKPALGATLLAVAAAVSPGPTRAGPILYDVTITNPLAVANPNVDQFANCLASQGCLGNAGLVDTPPGGNLPNTIPFMFTLNAAQVADVTGTAGVVGTFSIVASRDIGLHLPGADPDVIALTGDGTALGNLYQNTLDSCPPGERGVNYAATLVCGPNFHTDVTAADSITIGTALIQAFAADGTINFVLDPENSIGRLKIFSVNLQIAAAPEPGSLALAALGVALLALTQRRLKRQR